MGNQGQMMSLAPEGGSAMAAQCGLLVPPNCMTVPEGLSDGEVVWMPCNAGQSNQQWVIEYLDKLDGREWLHFRRSRQAVLSHRNLW
jgi:hypothetical protein